MEQEQQSGRRHTFQSVVASFLVTQSSPGSMTKGALVRPGYKVNQTSGNNDHSIAPLSHLMCEERAVAKSLYFVNNLFREN